jgi:rfaE bifunctional protein kinase chain/domain
MNHLEKVFNDCGSLKVAVVGDVMLDSYWWGAVERISPEAPVPVVSKHKSEHRIGGAGNVALNTVSLGAETTLFSVLGDDREGEILTELLMQKNIDTKFMVNSQQRITTHKTRIISKNQQMLRMDSEITTDISDDDKEQMFTNFITYVKRYQPGVVIFEDYNKGVLTADLIAAMIGICRDQGVVTAVDPKRKNFFAYKHADIFKPNLKEVKEALNMIFGEADSATLSGIHHQLYEQLEHKISLITLSEKGIFIQKGNFSRIISSHKRTIADVSGAGDTVIAVASLVYAASRDMTLAAEIANVAGGLVCEEVGTVAIQKDTLLNECKHLLC